MANNKSPSSNLIDKDSLEISDFLTKRYRGVSVYGAVMILLAIGIIWTAVLTAEQVQQYHEDYMALQKMKVEHRNLQIENQRLVIEQQTFSATPQIASRAVTQLGMYSPTTKDKLILQPTAAKPGDRLNIEQPKAADEAELTIQQQQGGKDE
ncbi:cell division protein FtsL [Psychrobacter sanguinis]|uniref:cell division protein FtsL n=1 Tax=Psychrobacter sanguinis TaxID=861445 RepID=UPI001919E938|nr:cell division protein FtsL [Psychrobacter sanguinis]MCC3308912.1 cell division protein FtsL [Psychrobacter sanguinis]MCC3345852.1 cell division protein FtsL [Psychrobacter sanguinis]UEC26203.1 cell division protein FtsL [Psychrobacter sanguinis]